MFNILEYYLPRLQRKKDIENINKLCYNYYKLNEKFITNINFDGQNIKLKNLSISFDNEIKTNFIVNDKFEIVNLIINLATPPGNNGFYPFVSDALKKCYNFLDEELIKFYKSRDEKIMNFQYKSENSYINQIIIKLKEVTYKNISLKIEEFQKFVDLFELDYKDEFIMEINEKYATYAFYDKEIQKHDNFKWKYEDYIHFKFNKICEMTKYYKAYNNIKYEKVNDVDFIKKISSEILEKEIIDSDNVVNILLKIIDRNILEYNNNYYNIIQGKAPYRWTTLHPWIDILKPLCGLVSDDDYSWIHNIGRHDEIIQEQIEQVLLIDEENSENSIPMRELKIKYMNSVPALIAKIKSLK